MIYSFITIVINALVVVCIGVQYNDNILSHFYGESCYLDFDEASEFGPYIKKLFCFKYFLWNDAVYTFIIFSLSGLIIQMMYTESNPPINKEIVVDNQELDDVVYKFSAIKYNELLNHKNKLKDIQTEFKQLMGDLRSENEALKNDYAELQNINEALIIGNEELINKLNSLQTIYPDENDVRMNKLQLDLITENEQIINENESLSNKLKELQNDYNILNRKYTNIKTFIEDFNIMI